MQGLFKNNRRIFCRGAAKVPEFSGSLNVNKKL